MKVLFLAVLLSVSLAKADEGYRKIPVHEKKNYVQAIANVVTKEILGVECGNAINWMSGPLVTLYIQTNSTQPLIIAEKVATNAIYQIVFYTDESLKIITQARSRNYDLHTSYVNNGDLVNPKIVKETTTEITLDVDCASKK